MQWSESLEERFDMGSLVCLFVFWGDSGYKAVIFRDKSLLAA